MTTQNIYKDIKHIVHISTGGKSSCNDCGKQLDRFDKLVNHYLEEHEYKLLHIGSEVTTDLEGKPWNNTVAVVGK